MAPASASLLPASSNANAGAKRPADAAVSNAETPLLPQDGASAGKNSQGQQLQQLECPRCNSSNTKFCYYNNYSTTQPRHFCRACRRYWTHGGTLRNVPVGGACRHGGNGSKRRRASSPSAETSASSGSPSVEDGYRPDIPRATFLPFLSDGLFLPQFDLGLGGCAVAALGFPWAPAAGPGSDLYDGIAASWGGGVDGTLTGGETGAWENFSGLELTWPPASN